MSGETEALAKFASSLKYEDIPERVREHTKNVLLDTLACAVAGHQGEETDQVSALATQMADSRETTVLGGDKLSLSGATLLNGYLITAVTMCGITSGVTWVSVERWMSHIVTAVMR